jgi:hypothetical protein
MKRLVCNLIARVALMFAFCNTSVAYGALMPRASIQQLCFKAELIVAGMHLGEGKVRVDEVFHSSSANAEAPGSISVPSIPRHLKTLAYSGGPPIATERVILFLCRNKEGTLEPIHLIKEGSQGLFWIEEDNCYGYDQLENPGPYRLSRNSRGVSNLNAMRKAIEIGLALRKRWESVQAIDDRQERARLMAAYLLPHTAPDGYEDQTLDLRQELRRLGLDAVPVLIDVVDKAQPNDDLNTTVLTLYDIGCVTDGAIAIRPAVPALCKLLQRPGPTHRYYILAPLQAAGDPQAIPTVRPFLEDKSPQVRGQAARALAAMKDRESFDVIAALLHASTDPNERTGATLELAKALFELDPARARPLIEQAEAHSANAGLHDFIDGW